MSSVVFVVLKPLDHYRRISGDDCIWFNAFGNDGACGDNRVFADRDAFQNHGIHADPDVVRNLNGSGFQFRTGRTVFEIGSKSLCIDQALSRRKRMKIRIGDTNIPRNKAIRSDLELFFGHNERAVEQGEISDRAMTILADGK